MCPPSPSTLIEVEIEASRFLQGFKFTPETDVNLPMSNMPQIILSKIYREHKQH